MYIFQKLKNLKEFWKRGGIACVEREIVSVGQELQGRRIVVTGGSNGLGLAMARRFAQEGASVVITGRNTVRLNGARDSIGRDNVYLLEWDVRDISIVEKRIEECSHMLGGPIDIFVNNAGIAKREAPEVVTEEIWDDVLSTDLKGSVFISKALCRRWREANHHGVLLNISSFAGVRGVVDAYGVAKTALIQLTSGLAREYAPYGIRINAIAPGVIVGTNVNAIQRSISSDGNLFCASYPARRFGVPSEIADVALFLVSDRSSYIYGQTIVVDGGATL